MIRSFPKGDAAARPQSERERESDAFFIPHTEGGGERHAFCIELLLPSLFLECPGPASSSPMPFFPRPSHRSCNRACGHSSGVMALSRLLTSASRSDICWRKSMFIEPRRCATGGGGAFVKGAMGER
eukprot:3841573-Pleurochrysis_carterae.AAC.1